MTKPSFAILLLLLLLSGACVAFDFLGTSSNVAGSSPFDGMQDVGAIDAEEDALDEERFLSPASKACKKECRTDSKTCLKGKLLACLEEVEDVVWATLNLSILCSTPN